jgi:diguanylate cyclase
MPYFAVGNPGAHARALAFVRRVYPMRILGVTLLALPYASLLAEQHAAAWMWWTMAFNVLAWPHLAYQLARRARDPVAAEFRSLVLDAVSGGFWIVAGQFSLVPAAAMVSILAADRLAAGGWPLLGRAALALLLSVLLCGWALGWPFHPATSLRTMACALPPLVLYLLALSHVSYRLARQIVHQNRELDRLNRTDPVLDLPNRRFFNLHASAMIEQVRADGGEAVLLLVDVDRFKTINDRHGHVTGDEVLRGIAAILHEQAGADGFPARVGGDEFALLLRASRPQGEALVERLRQAVAAMPVHDCPELAVGVSIGLARLEPHHRGLDDWMGAADRAMYVAKAAGRAGA